MIIHKNKTFIIAEAGVNHNGSLILAKKLIDAAVEARADAFKIQTFKAKNIVIPKESQYNLLKRLELSDRDHERLMAYCRKKNILFMSSVFDKEGVDLLDMLGVEIFKIPSGEITNKPLLQYTASKGRPIILSTGMSTLTEVKEAVRWIKKIPSRIPPPPLYLLHCVSEYPANIAHINLLAMKTLSKTFHLPVGYSDHSLGIEIPLAAVSLGAKVIEKHFTLDKNMPGPDHKASLEPKELIAMINAIRNIEKALGSGIKKPTPTEEETKKLVRKSLVAARDIRRGKKIGESDIAIKRPGHGIPPSKINEVIHKRACADIPQHTLLTHTHFR